MDNWTLLVLLLGSTIALTAFVTIVIRHRFRGNTTIAVASILGIFAGVGGASHGPGEILQGNIAPSGIIIEAWPELTLLAGEPAMTLVPSFSVSGILTIITGVAVTIWVATRIQSKSGASVLILLSTLMLFVGGGLIPPALGVVAGIIGSQLWQKDLKTSNQKV
ncbi:MAG TPA: hypothetical protein VHF65_01700 [Nitrososphaera sp.]|nr:hypothetical protein [Nitrososphaera sp.]